jgi:hypothetical protein
MPTSSKNENVAESYFYEIVKLCSIGPLLALMWLLARLLDALHESQVRRSCRELHRFRHLVQSDQSPRCIGRD